jgi:signal transduction histidine kinase
VAIIVATACGTASAAIASRGVGRRFRDQIAHQDEQHCRARAELERTFEGTLNEGAQRASDFLANTVHELRTPLTTVIASLDMLYEGYATTPEERREVTEQGAAACRHLMMLINDLLDTTAYESGKLHVDLQECSVEDLVRDAQHLLRPLAIARGVDLQIVVSEADLHITTDRSRILQVLFNLVGNALKFAPSGGCVLLQALVTPIGVAFEVVDDGPGVPPGARVRLFTKYGRLHDSQSPSGTGIGLYLSKILVEQMNGSIGYMQRDPGPGSIFWFTLPSANRSALAEPGVRQA